MRKSLKKTLTKYILEQKKKGRNTISIMELLIFLKEFSPEEIQKQMEKFEKEGKVKEI